MFIIYCFLLYLCLIFTQWPTSSHLIPESAPELGDVIKYMQTAKIIRASVPKVGTQLKVMLTLEGGQKVLFKPQW